MSQEAKRRAVEFIQRLACVRCGLLAQEFDIMIITKDGLAHRQCSKGAN